MDDVIHNMIKACDILRTEVSQYKYDLSSIIENFASEVQKSIKYVYNNKLGVYEVQSAPTQPNFQSKDILQPPLLQPQGDSAFDVMPSITKTQSISKQLIDFANKYKLETALGAKFTKDIKDIAKFDEEPAQNLHTQIKGHLIKKAKQKLEAFKEKARNDMLSKFNEIDEWYKKSLDDYDKVSENEYQNEAEALQKQLMEDIKYYHEYIAFMKIVEEYKKQPHNNDHGSCSKDHYKLQCDIGNAANSMDCQIQTQKKLLEEKIQKTSATASNELQEKFNKKTIEWHQNVIVPEYNIKKEDIQNAARSKVSIEANASKQYR